MKIKFKHKYKYNNYYHHTYRRNKTYSRKKTKKWRKYQARCDNKMKAINNRKKRSTPQGMRHWKMTRAYPPIMWAERPVSGKHISARPTSPTQADQNKWAIHDNRFMAQKCNLWKSWICLGNDASHHSSGGHPRHKTSEARKPPVLSSGTDHRGSQQKRRTVVVTEAASSASDDPSWSVSDEAVQNALHCKIRRPGRSSPKVVGPAPSRGFSQSESQ